MKEQETFHLFWRGPFSQWQPSKFIVEGVVYNCCEQYMMAQKARLFGDQETYEKIMASKSPRDQKSLGREVKNFDQTTWEAVARTIVFRGNMAKFSQNIALLATLLTVKETTLVEASPYDKVWGIGMAEDHPDARNRSKWQGKNWLGEVLTDVRNELIAARSITVTTAKVTSIETTSNPSNQTVGLVINCDSQDVRKGDVMAIK